MTQTNARRQLALFCLILCCSNKTIADEPPCESDLNLSPWLNAVTSNFVDGGASGDSSIGYTLCSSAPGPGDMLDSARLLVQTAGGDFTFEASLTELTAGGAGGVVLTLSGLTLVEAPRLLMWVEADSSDPSTGFLYSSLRREAHDQAEPGPAGVAVDIPLRIQIDRVAGVITASYNDGGGFTPHQVVDVTGEPLGGTVRIGMAQFSADDEVTRFAHFDRLEMQAAPAPGLACVEGDPLLAGDQISVVGRNLDAVIGVSAFGNRAEIIEQEAGHMLIRPQAPDSSVNYGKIEFSSAASRYPVTAKVSSIGTAFIRGDTNFDGQVDHADSRDLRAWFSRGWVPACPGAADVNGDSHINLADLNALNAWLDGTDRAPAAPFPDAGMVRGAYTCDAPGAPDIRAMRLADNGRPRPLVEGDVIELTGKGLPRSDELIVWFDEVRTRTLGGDSRSLKVLVQDVPSDGYRCARIIHAMSQQQGDPLRVGGGWLATEGSGKLCFNFQASSGSDHGFVSQTASDGSMEVSIPRRAWQPGQNYQIDTTVFLPWLDGVSSGSRALQMSFLAPRGADDEYAHGLESLASAMTTALNGGYQASTPCDCELEVIANPLAEKLILAPCFPPPPKPEPVAPGPNQWQAPPPDPIGGINILANNPPPFECDGEFVSHKDDARKAAWCHFRDVTQPITEDSFDPPFLPAVGHPEFAAWQPLATVIDSQYGGMDEPWIVAPDEQPLLMKHILFEPETESQLSAMDYNNPHIWLARQRECVAFPSTWMPKISFGHRIAKTFFVREAMLPSSVNTAGLYSYIPPGSNERHYLVGLHLAISTLHDYGSNEGYFWWASFWVPAAINDTQTKNGQDLAWSYSPTCTVGNGVDRPLDLPPPWNRFVMCTDATNGHEACGNPYAFGECPLNGDTTSCTQCHRDTGNIGNHGLEMAWLPSVAHALNQSDMDNVSDYLDAHPGEFTWWTEPRDVGIPTKCDKSAPTLWNPFDPNDFPGDGEG